MRLFQIDKICILIYIKGLKKRLNGLIINLVIASCRPYTTV